MSKKLMIILGLFIAVNTNAAQLDEIETILSSNKEEVVKEKLPKQFEDSDIKRKLKDGSVQKFDGEKYKIVPRTKKVTKKIHEVVIKRRVTHRNRASLLVGHGNLGNIRENPKANGTEHRTEQGLVLGLQYQRSVRVRQKYELTIGVQGQTNKTFSGMVGVGF